ncbi:Asp-tRNA(Asn)/Glu-tRNA(Gln) amidotransferase subunit GatC [Candidatus Gottesmanbacteria bacterium]|nr:Asp-tRNA(Asn)/Glu-tRNA(Gln) amidotransferase subunit GatC [Candidatus Gottesmanbacteria bacterium]
MNEKSLSVKQVSHITQLAHLPINEKDMSILASELKKILDLVNTLQNVDTHDVEPTSQVTGLSNVFREDKVTASLSQEEALSNAKATHKGFFVVPAIFE